MKLGMKLTGVRLRENHWLRESYLHRGIRRCLRSPLRCELRFHQSRRLPARGYREPGAARSSRDDPNTLDDPSRPDDPNTRC